MQIVLLEKVENLGAFGTVVKVKDGYARNYLIPKGKAMPATKENIADVERRQAELKQVEAEVQAEAEARKQKIDGAILTIVAKVSDEGALFGAVGSTDIMEAVKNACGEEVQRKEVLLPDGAFRKLGEYEVSFKLHPSVTATVQLKIIAEE